MSQMPPAEKITSVADARRATALFDERQARLNAKSQMPPLPKPTGNKKATKKYAPVPDVARAARAFKKRKTQFN
jgi:hypothetical protein